MHFSGKVNGVDRFIVQRIANTHGCYFVQHQQEMYCDQFMVSLNNTVRYVIIKDNMKTSASND